MFPEGCGEPVEDSSTVSSGPSLNRRGDVEIGGNEEFAF